MRKLKKWLYERFLPYWVKEDYLADMERAHAKIKALEQENKELRAYIKGVQDVIAHRMKVEIHNGGQSNE